MNVIKFYFFKLICAGIFFIHSAQAQKLPKIQERNQFMSSQILIDGVAEEWGPSFSAYSSTNRIYYTVANDDHNLYLAIQSADYFANEKVLFGIGFGVRTLVPKSNKDQIKVIYPTIISDEDSENMRFSIVQNSRRARDSNDSEDKRKVDSLKIAGNTFIKNKYNSVYLLGDAFEQKSFEKENGFGVEVGAAFNNDMLYTYELKIPLKLLGVSKNSGQEINYNIVLEGLSRKLPGRPSPPDVRSPNALPNPDMAYLSYATNLSGTYTLALK